MSNKIHTVQAGESLWLIAKRLLGKASRYTEIVAANGLKTSVLYPGQQLLIPEI